MRAASSQRSGTFNKCTNICVLPHYNPPYILFNLDLLWGPKLLFNVVIFAAWLVGACLSDRSAALDVKQLHTQFQSFCWVGSSVGTLMRGKKSTHEALIARTCVNVFLCTHRYMSRFCPWAGVFSVCVCVLFLRENMQTLTCAKGFWAEPSGNGTGAFCHTSSPPSPPNPRPEPSWPLMPVQRG